MNITLKELARGYQSLTALCGQVLPRENGELITRLSRIKRAARKAMEIWEEDQKTIAVSYGFKLVGPGQAIPLNEDTPVSQRTAVEFGEHCDKIMKAETVHFRGERFTAEEWKAFKPLFNLSPQMEDDLEWLIPEEGAEEENAPEAAKSQAMAG